MKPKVMYCVMIGSQMYPGSLSHDKEGAASYLGDARLGASSAAEQTGRKITARLCRVALTKVREPKPE